MAAGSRAADSESLSRTDTQPKEYLSYKAVSYSAHQELCVHIHRGQGLGSATLQ